MARVEAKIVVPVGVDTAFAVSQTQGEIRYRWDPFVRSQQLLDGATVPGETFGGGWSFRAIDEDRTEATWRYVFAIRPGWLSRLAEPFGLRLLQHDIERRMAGFTRGCEDPVVVAAAGGT